MWNQKRVFEMVNTRSCLYNDGNNPVKRKNLRIQRMENYMNEGCEKVKGDGIQSTCEGLYLC